mmetsp:Transcript_51979/g.111118  ORF Transcript_51979/g.111118 Transcript_51979/m.111118 type:complete len:244 (-) Transcript_51979:60-791(-)
MPYGFETHGTRRARSVGLHTACPQRRPAASCASASDSAAGAGASASCKRARSRPGWLHRGFALERVTHYRLSFVRSELQQPWLPLSRAGVCLFIGIPLTQTIPVFSEVVPVRAWLVSLNDSPAYSLDGLVGRQRPSVPRLVSLRLPDGCLVARAKASSLRVCIFTASEPVPLYANAGLALVQGSLWQKDIFKSRLVIFKTGINTYAHAHAHVPVPFVDMGASDRRRTVCRLSETWGNLHLGLV